MTVSTTSNVKTSTGDGSTTDFAFTFPFFNNSEIVVTVDGATKTETTDYTLTNDDPGGTVSFLVAPAASTEVIVTRTLPLTQAFDYIDNDDFPAESHEEALDRVVMISQQLQEQVDRAIKVDTGTTVTADDLIADITAAKNNAEDAADQAVLSENSARTFGAVADNAQKLAKRNQQVLSGINTQTGTSYTLALSDAGGAVEMNNGSANTLTVPANSSVAFKTKTVIEVVALGAGTTTIAAAGGVTIRSADSALDLRTQYSGATLYKRGTDEWVLVGDLA